MRRVVGPAMDTIRMVTREVLTNLMNSISLSSSSSPTASTRMMAESVSAVLSASSSADLRVIAYLQPHLKFYHAIQFYVGNEGKLTSSFFRAKRTAHSCQNRGSSTENISIMTRELIELYMGRSLEAIEHSAEIRSIFSSFMQHFSALSHVLRFRTCEGNSAYNFSICEIIPPTVLLSQNTPHHWASARACAEHDRAHDLDVVGSIETEGSHVRLEAVLLEVLLDRADESRIARAAERVAEVSRASSHGPESRTRSR